MEIMELPLDQIQPNPNNPRREWGDLEGLARSIGRIGLMSPLVVARDGSAYRLLAGERRLRAMRDHTEVRRARCLVCDGMDEVAEAMAITGDNAFRKDFTDEEAARGVQQMLMLGVDELDVAAASGADEDDVSAMELAVIRERSRMQRARAAGGAAAPRQFSFYEARMLDYAYENGASDDEMDALMDAENMEAEYWRFRLKAEAAARARESEKAIEQSGAARVEWEDFEAMEEGSYTYYVHYSPIGMKGCGCDGFSATIDPSDGRVKWFCAKPANHEGEDPERAARLARARSWDEAQGARRAFIVSKITGTTGGAQFTWWMQEQVKASLERDMDRFMQEGNPDGIQDTFFVRCLARAWSRSEVSYYSLLNPGTWNQEDRRRFLAYYDMLVGQGYEPAASESETVEAARNLLARTEAEERGGE